MRLEQIRAYLGEDWTRTVEQMNTALSSDIDLLNGINDSISANSGKQLRPLLSVLIGRCCGAGPLGPDSYRCAAAAELLHNATLLHDDVADSSDRRRGRPTLSSLMGSNVSVLVGDYWLVKAVECVLNTECFSEKIIRGFARTLALLAEGEMLQLEKAAKGDTTEEDYYRIIYNKTASLFESTALTAAYAVHAEESLCEAVASYAVNLGIAFQIKDDIFDYTPGAQIGKPVGADILERKITLPLLGALSNVDAARQKEIREAVTSIQDAPEGRDMIVEFVRENGGIEYAQRKLREYATKAIEAIEALPQSREKEYLVELAGFVGDRNS
ncbi:MAG: polyprenyl synthetase family protein [Bacteroidales bacterium]|nr:polyprenyl synthetase family protein [Bacteroidales bacterium]